VTDTGPFAYSVQRLAVAWGCSARHVYELCARGELGHLRIGNLIRIRQADKEAYEARQWHAPSLSPLTTDSSSAEIVSMSAGGRTGPGSAFQRGRRSGAATSDFVVEHGGYQVASVKTGTRAAARRANLPGVTPHVLRHTAATWMAMAGVPMVEIARILGHRDSRITERVYAKHSPDYLRRAIGALSA
jgi:excisionase family DNA binding protein